MPSLQIHARPSRKLMWLNILRGIKFPLDLIIIILAVYYLIQIGFYISQKKDFYDLLNPRRRAADRFPVPVTNVNTFSQ